MEDEDAVVQPGESVDMFAVFEASIPSPVPMLPEPTHQRWPTTRDIRPTCPRCNDADCRNGTGSGKGRYKYQCNACLYKWHQRREYDPVLGWDVRESNFAVGLEKKRAEYKCGICGQKKRGHTCTGAQGVVVTTEDVMSLPPLRSEHTSGTPTRDPILPLVPVAARVCETAMRSCSATHAYCGFVK